MNLYSFLIETQAIENILTKTLNHSKKKAIDEEFYIYHNTHVDMLTREKVTPEQRNTLKHLLRKYST